MRGLFVGGGRDGRAVNLDQDKAAGSVGLLHNVKAGDAGLAHAGAGVLKAGVPEGRDGFGPDVDMDMDNEHGERGSDLSDKAADRTCPNSSNAAEPAEKRAQT